MPGVSDHQVEALAGHGQAPSNGIRSGAKLTHTINAAQANHTGRAGEGRSKGPWILIQIQGL